MRASNRKASTLTSGVMLRPPHPFPARMAPEIALDAVRHAPEGSLVVDPMVGSGTTAMMGKLAGHHVRGFDLDPLAALMADVWSNPPSPNALVHNARNVLSLAEQRFWQLHAWEGFPARSDAETRRFIAYWFNGINRRQLTCLSAEIMAVGDDAVRHALWCGFSRMIVTKQGGVSRAMDLAHSRPHRVNKATLTKPFDIFMREINRVASICEAVAAIPTSGSASIERGDARQIPIDDNAADVVVTSPPYLNAIDYIRGHKFSLVWMGYALSELRGARATAIGSEHSSHGTLDSVESAALSAIGDTDRLSNRIQGIIKRYVKDIRLLVGEVSRILKPGGSAVFVIGNSTVRGVYLTNSAAIVVVAERLGLRLLRQMQREIPRNRRYLPPPSIMTSGSDLDARMRHEVVLSFVRRQ